MWMISSMNSCRWWRKRRTRMRRKRRTKKVCFVLFFLQKRLLPISTNMCFDPILAMAERNIWMLMVFRVSCATACFAANYHSPCFHHAKYKKAKKSFVSPFNSNGGDHFCRVGAQAGTSWSTTTGPTFRTSVVFISHPSASVISNADFLSCSWHGKSV